MLRTAFIAEDCFITFQVLVHFWTDLCNFWPKFLAIILDFLCLQDFYQYHLTLLMYFSKEELTGLIFCISLTSSFSPSIKKKEDFYVLWATLSLRKVQENKKNFRKQCIIQPVWLINKEIPLFQLLLLKLQILLALSSRKMCC